MNLVGALAHRWFDVDGRTYLVRPPVVGEALALYVSGRGFLDGDGSHTAALLEVLRDWLPLRLYDTYRVQISNARLRERLGIDRASIVQSILAVAGEGPKPEKKISVTDTSTEEMLDALLAADWDHAIRRYAAVFACEPQRVLTGTYWPLFLATMKWPSAIEAARQLQEIEASSFPHVSKAGDRDKVLRRLNKSAGYDNEPDLEDLTEEERIEQFKRNVMSI